MRMGVRFNTTVLSSVAVAAISMAAAGTFAAVVTDKGDGVGGAAGSGLGGTDAYWRFNAAQETQTTTTTLLVKRGGTGETVVDDRLAMLKFDTTGLGTASDIQFAALNLTVQDATTHAFPNGYVYQLWGIPDQGAQELTDPTTLTAATSVYTTGTNGNHAAPAGDGFVGNRVDDTLLTFLGSYTVTTPPVPAANSVISIQSDALAAFLRANTNNVASFLLTAAGTAGTANPTVFSSRNATGIPTLVTNIDVPEPASLGVLAAGLVLAGGSRRRSR